MKPKIVLWDIETSHNIVAAFQLYDAQISHQAIREERYMICASWKYLGKPKVYAVSALDDPKRFRSNYKNDYHIVKTIHKVLSDADAVIAHYGNKFDIKFLRGRALFHKLKPLPPIIQIDTHKIAKSEFLLNSNRLDYLGHYLGVGRKIKTSLDLWLDCLDGKEKAIKRMIRYNKQDVRLLEDVYTIIAPYSRTQLNMNLFDGCGCPLCGSSRVQRRGDRLTSTNRFDRYQCIDCGKWYSQPSNSIAR